MKYIIFLFRAIWLALSLLILFFSMHRLSQSAGGRGDRFCRRPGKEERAEAVSNGKAWWQNDGADEK